MNPHTFEPISLREITQGERMMETRRKKQAYCAVRHELPTLRKEFE